MQIIRHYEDVPSEFRGGVVVLGNFDGVHRGHQAVIGRASQAARAAGVSLVLITFEPHPRRFFRPEDPPFSLTPFCSKAHYLAPLGVDLLVLLHFDERLSQKPAEKFSQEVLCDAFTATQVVVGYDFVFGHGRKGNVELLRKLSAKQGFELVVVEPAASADGGIYSSTRVREYLATGKPGHAAALLGRPFEIEGRVLRGDHRGVKIGFPTANIGLQDYLRPAFGVYAVRAGEAAGRRTSLARRRRKPWGEANDRGIYPLSRSAYLRLFGRPLRQATQGRSNRVYSARAQVREPRQLERADRRRLRDSAQAPANARGGRLLTDSDTTP